MNFSGKDIIKFLFPELQIIGAIKKHGFIVRQNKNNVEKQTENMEKVYRDRNNYSENNSGEMSKLRQQIVANKSKISEKINESNYHYKDNSKVNNNKISKIFSSIREEMGNKIIGQTNYLDNICIAFKRPFVTGYDRLKPKNVIIVLGNKGTGKHSSISFITELLKQKNLFNSDEVLTIDLSLYATVSEFGVFLSDLYKCLYGQSDIVMFDNIDKCHSSVVDAIETLTTTGKYTLQSRYIFQNNNLIETTGALLQDSISEISSNSKYFVFASEKSEKDVLNIFGSNFMECVGDIIHTENFNYDDLNKISIRIIENLKGKCRENLSMKISYDKSICEIIASNYKSSSGVNGMEKFVDFNIYKPLAEIKLKNNILNKQSIFLSTIDGELVAQIGNSFIKLTDIIPQRNTSGIDDAKKELENIIGLKSVKQYVESLEDNLKIQKMRESSGFKAANISMHMIFTGNPGTGKTTIARIVAKYLKELGILSQGQLREVTRADLVGQYVGHTAKLTNDVIKSSLGGVLFIDEAYALCRDKEDIFGIEAIDTLVKGIEDNREDLVVILAGYKDEMNDFLKTNSGLKSRFPNIINFEDYTPEEMYKISLVTAKSKGYKVSESCKESLIKLFEKRQIKGKNDSGNGRLVRNIIEDSILNQSKRLLENPNADMGLLSYDDFKFEETHKFDLEASLSKIIGLDNVKDFVRTQYKLLIAQEKRRKAGMNVDTSQALNMIFSGNPGTGKTTIARLVSQMFKEMGLLKSGHLVEVDRGSLVAEYAGQTSKKTEEVFKSALGGVLFIDEAYALSSDSSGFGKEAIDTLVKLIEDYRGEIIVILAGYKKEMTEFLKTNSGLKSRFPLNIDFPDYTADELFKITLKMIYDKGFVLEKGAIMALEEQVSLLHKQSNTNSGNGRMVRNYLEEVMRKQSARIAVNDVPTNEMNMIISDDIEQKNKSTTNFDLEEELSKIVGLQEVKDYISSLSARLRMQNERKKLGLTVDTTQTLHMIFKGNPGTGKTMVARTVAEVLYNIGIIKTNKLVETDRSGLVAGYVGQTAMKTREKVMEAMDGVLFIDEAYSLSQGGANDFGKEAIDTLVKLMDDYRDRIVVILAGYSHDMDQFLSVNAGLKSRFPNVINFEDYSTNELMQIAGMLFKSKGYELNLLAKNKLKDIFNVVRLESQFGNGRYVRNLYERAINNQAMRLSTDMDLTKEELVTIIDTDIERV
ncbi:AAA family ATPase [Clostridium botulinum]|uniref:AAA family ATPase n=1 Tax=Clostridium botulinum TaxID=1491 RepID=UPI003DA44345